MKWNVPDANIRQNVNNNVGEWNIVWHDGEWNIVWQIWNVNVTKGIKIIKLDMHYGTQIEKK